MPGWRSGAVSFPVSKVCGGCTAGGLDALRIRFEGTICGRLDNPPDRGRHDPGVLAIGDQGLVAGALHDLEAGVLSQFRELALQGGQQLATDWLLADRQHDQRQVTERLSGIQLLAAAPTKSGSARLRW